MNKQCLRHYHHLPHEWWSKGTRYLCPGIGREHTTLR